MNTTLHRCVQDRSHWISAFILGLFSSTYSTLIITLGAGRIGRDISVDWMQVGTVFFGRGIIGIQPAWYTIFAGVFAHQSADILWALVFFGLLWRWTRNLTPGQILVVGIPWALLTAAIEYYLVYPLLPYLHHLIRQRSLEPPDLWSKVWIGILMVVLILPGTLLVAEHTGQKLALPGIQITRKFRKVLSSGR